MNKIKLTTILIILQTIAVAQISKTNIAEHFTNTNCSICASSNPGIFSTLANFPNVLHVAFHPSSPYSSCFFSMQNPIENDARTNYYGIYGGTPRLMVNGILTNASNLNTSLNALTVATTSFEIRTTQEFLNIDSVKVKIIIKKIAADTIQQAYVFVGAFEDSVFQTTANGESVHHDVFRKAMSIPSGDLIPLLPSGINDSIILDYAYKVLPNWNASRMNTIAILQQVNKSVINSSLSTNISSIPSSLTTTSSHDELSIFPNPCSNYFQLQNGPEYKNLILYNSIGGISLNKEITNAGTDVSGLPNGFYIVELINKDGKKVRQKLIKK